MFVCVPSILQLGANFHILILVVYLRLLFVNTAFVQIYTKEERTEMRKGLFIKENFRVNKNEFIAVFSVGFWFLFIFNFGWELEKFCPIFYIFTVLGLKSSVFLGPFLYPNDWRLKVA